MTAHGTLIPRKKKELNQANNPKSDKYIAITKYKKRTYGFDRLNIGDPAVKSKNNLKWLLLQHM